MMLWTKWPENPSHAKDSKSVGPAPSIWLGWRIDPGGWRIRHAAPPAPLQPRTASRLLYTVLHTRNPHRKNNNNLLYLLIGHIMTYQKIRGGCYGLYAKSNIGGSNVN